MSMLHTPLGSYWVAATSWAGRGPARSGSGRVVAGGGLVPDTLHRVKRMRGGGLV